jgi:signal peptidase II
VDAVYYGAGLAAIAIDQLTKAWVVVNLPPYDSVDIVPFLSAVISLTSVQNTGVAFGLFPGLGRIFTVLSVLVVIGIVIFRRTVPRDQVWVHAALGLVSGGALGNAVDRLLRGYVVDFLDANLWPFGGWPVFNLADAAIVIGVGVLLVDSWYGDRKQDVEDA